MKKKIFALSLALILALSLAACGGKKAATLKVAASPTPHAEILSQCVDILKEQGIELVVTEYSDYVVPNTAVEDGDEDANYFQHVPYLDNFNAERGTHLVSVAGVHIEPMGLYAGNSASLDAIPDGGKVAVPNDPTNEGRALLLRQLTEELFRYCMVLSDPGDLAPEPISLNAVLESSLAAFYAELTGRGVQPVVHMPPEKVVRRLDRAALSRVFSNLLSNAAKYSDGDLEITLTPGGAVVFANSSRSLSSVEVQKLFDRFYTVEAARKSTGLGLSIARALAERMGGELAAEYREGKLYITAYFPL